GTSTDFLSPANAFDFEFQGREDNHGFAIKKGMLNASFFARNQAEADILNEFYGADEDEWRAKLYVNGVHKWTGKVITDLFDIADGPFPKECKIAAKDLSSIDGKKIAGADFNPVNYNFIQSIAQLINAANNYDLPIHSYTGFEHEGQ